MSYGRRYSNDSAQRPLSNVDYSQTDQHDQPYHNQSDPYNQSQTGYGTGYASTPTKKKSKRCLWILLAVLAVIAIVGGVVGGVLGSRASQKNSASSVSNGADNVDGSSSSGGGSNGGGTATGSAPTATRNGNPVFPSSTAVLIAPSLRTEPALSCGADPYTFPAGGSLAVRREHPLLYAPAYKWQCLPKLIAADSYMSRWHDTILANATLFASMAPVPYTPDGGLSGSGVLDVAREIQLRIKHWGYAWKLTNDTKWVDRTWQELVVASGNSTTQSFGTRPDNWNTQHFLDLAEFTSAFAIAYDWMYEAWTPTQRNAIMWSIINLGLNYGLNAYNPAGSAYSWWTEVNGNWNCVCNNGLTAGALAIANEDPTGIAARILAFTVPNAAANCAMGPSSDGTWSETPAYWYFGTTGHAQMAQSLIVATGTDHGLMTSNPAMQLSALYHMYVTGLQGIFAYGDTGPNKFTATANGIMFYASYFNSPRFSLFQRDRSDAAEPMSMLFYDPQVTGDFFQGLPLDRHFDSTTDGWLSARSSWTDVNGTYIALKAGALQGHQTHGNLDAGTFVFDALGQRWAGELGSGDYLATGYFSSEDQDSDRWLVYRTRTEGQNTLLLGGANQLVVGVPTTTYDSTGDSQTALSFTPPGNSTAYMTTDLSSVYGTPATRAIRFINGRKQILLRDEVTVPRSVQWRMHTNATVALSNNGRTATLSLGGETLIANLRSPATASFTTQAPVRLASDPNVLPGTLSADQPNTGTVLTVALGAGNQVIEVVFNPQVPGAAASSTIVPADVAISGWSLTSHA